MIRKTKPTPKDLEILQLLKSYPHLSSIQIQQMAGTIDHRDCFYRLRRNGTPVQSRRINYVKDGKNGWYMIYFLLNKAA
jgi:hypothetical protein